MIGEKIHMYRKQSKKTLNQMAEITGLSASYLSQLERNRIDPSLSSLRKIASALEMPVFLFLEDDHKSEGYVLRKEDRIVMTFPDITTSYEVVSTMPNKTITPAALMVFCTIKPLTYDSDIYVCHDSDEIALVYEGEITVFHGSNTSLLHEGDTIFIPRNTPHRYYNHTDKPVSCYVVSSPCTWPAARHDRNIVNT